MKLVEHIFRLIAPHDCVECGREGSLLCIWCSDSALTPADDTCYRCTALSHAPNATCKNCRQYSRLDYVWSRSEYNTAAKKLVYQLKFNHARDAASVIARELQSILPVFGPSTLLVHAPAASSRVRQRGYDQSALIARELSRLTALPHVHALRRLGQQRQVGSTRQQRLAQMKEAYWVVSPAVIQGAHIILVDDVLTTGGTLEAAATALKAAGARRVDAVTFARAK